MRRSKQIADLNFELHNRLNTQRYMCVNVIDQAVQSRMLKILTPVGGMWFRLSKIGG